MQPSATWVLLRAVLKCWCVRRRKQVRKICRHMLSKVFWGTPFYYYVITLNSFIRSLVLGGVFLIRIAEAKRLGTPLSQHKTRPFFSSWLALLQKQTKSRLAQKGPSKRVLRSTSFLLWPRFTMPEQALVARIPVLTSSPPRSFSEELVCIAAFESCWRG